MSERSCKQVDSIYCTAPPGHRDSHTKGTCFACGEPVCTACSLRVKYSTYGVQRLCHDCLEMHLGEPGRVRIIEHHYVLAGYSKAQGRAAAKKDDQL
jgi:hypothetical protein